MTDSMKTTLRLTKMSAAARMDVDANICNVSNPWGEVKGRYTKPSHQQSALAKTKTKWVVRCAVDPDDPDKRQVPVEIEAELNIPNAVLGHNLEHGTSVFAAGVAALELQRIWMAESGLPQHELDLLTTADVTLRGVTLTYLIVCLTKEAAVALMEAVKQTGKILNPNCEVWDSTNLTVILPARDHTVKFYIKTDLEHCKSQDGAPVADFVEQALHIVRIEVVLGARFLEARNLLTLDSWRTAYEKGMYKEIFNQTVRKALRLDGKRLHHKTPGLASKPLRHKAPREEVYAKLTPEAARLLHGYIEHGRDPRKFRGVVESKNPAKRLSELRREILEVADIDIDIPWKKHVLLRCFELADQLRYPGDYHPAEERVVWCFCEANWPALLDKMRQTYQWALVRAAEKSSDRNNVEV